MYKIIITLVLLLLIILFNQNNEDFIGFRKLGMLTEIENDLSLFPYIIENKNLNKN